MLRHLRIKDLILVEDAVAEFGPGFNVISGETGAGKSAILAALRLILGGKSEGKLVRTDCTKGVVEALFELEESNPIKDLLTNGGIDCSEHSDHLQLIIRRELSATGKSRAFINNQLAHLTLLKEVGKNLIEIVGQHAGQKLFSLEYHRFCLDLFGDCMPLLQEYTKAFHEEKSLAAQMEKLRSEEALRNREKEICERQIIELQEAAVEEGEEEIVFTEYTRMTHMEELSSGLRQLTGLLNGNQKAMIPVLTTQASLWSRLVSLDDSLSESSENFRSSVAELQEIDYTLRQYANRLLYHPERYQQLSDRLAIINKIKNKYGPTVEEINQYLKSTIKKFDRLENSDVELEKIEKAFVFAIKKTEEVAKALSLARKNAAIIFAKKIEEELQNVNMPNARFAIEVAPCTRTHYGDDRVIFHLAPNKGERMVPLKECASGGELARVLLSIKILLAGKELIPTLIFDEIDANIGGRTATIVAKKLKELGEKHQILCVTHFAQVAREADHQLTIEKHIVSERTMTKFFPINPERREMELARMQGDI